MKNSLKVVFVIIGTLIGAGFASGKEVYIFFNKYGSLGLLGVVLSGIFISIVIYKVLKITKENELQSYNNLITGISKSKNISKLLKNIISVFLLISFFVMVSGFASYFYEQLGINSVVMSIIMAILCFITFNKNIEGITKVNTILIPFLIVFIVISAILNSKCFINNFNYIDVNMSIKNEISFSNNWIISAILYASYNSIILIPILIGLKGIVEKKSIGKISCLTGIIFIILGISLYSLLTSGQNYVQYLDIPIIFIMKQFGNIYSNIYGIVVAIAIFTSAISAGYGFLEKFEYSKSTYKKVSVIICVVSVFVAMIKFSYLVEILYPIFGLLGFISYSPTPWRLCRGLPCYGGSLPKEGAPSHRRMQFLSLPASRSVRNSRRDPRRWPGRASSFLPAGGCLGTNEGVRCRSRSLGAFCRG